MSNYATPPRPCRLPADPLRPRHCTHPRQPAGVGRMSLGKPLPHDAAPLHVTGQARYVDDIPLPANTLHLAFGLSTCAHGEITGLDLAAVRAAITAMTP